MYITLASRVEGGVEANQTPVHGMVVTVAFYTDFYTDRRRMLESKLYPKHRKQSNMEGVDEVQRPMDTFAPQRPPRNRLGNLYLSLGIKFHSYCGMLVHITSIRGQGEG